MRTLLLYRILLNRLRFIILSSLLILACIITTSKVLANDTGKEESANAVATEEKGDKHHSDDDHSRLSDQPTPLQLEDFPNRPRPIFEWPARFLGNGNLLKGFKIPTGAVWQPYFVVFGTYRTAVQHFDPAPQAARSEWANNFNLFANLYLTFTERILIGFQPFQQDGEFSGYNFKPEDGTDGWRDRTNFNIRTLFFEGDFGELFPFLDPDDKWHWDLGFSVGRQLISFQEGLLINDNIDAVGLTTVNLKPPTTINTRVTLLYSWNDIHRTGFTGNNFEDENASLFGLLTETDWRKSTVAIDVVYVNSNTFGGDGLYFGIDAVQRLGFYSTSFRVTGSVPIGDETEFNRDGLIAFAEISRTPFGTHNHLYLNAYYGYKNFRSAARAPAAGGPLGRTGILFAAVGLGRYGAPLSNFADESFGGALGYQMFFAHNRKQLILEGGGRYATDNFGQRALAAGARYQMAVGQRLVTVLDGFGSYHLNRGVGDNEFRFGGRLEVLVKF